MRRLSHPAVISEIANMILETKVKYRKDGLWEVKEEVVK